MRLQNFSEEVSYNKEEISIQRPAEKLRECLLVGAPAFMRGKERFSAPGKGFAFDRAL
jgi:hypothetical protein